MINDSDTVGVHGHLYVKGEPSYGMSSKLSSVLLKDAKPPRLLDRGLGLA